MSAWLEPRRLIWAAFGLVCLATVLLVLLQQDPVVRGLMRNTAFLAASVCGLAVPLGTVVAMLLFRTDLAGRRWATAIVLSLLLVPLYLQAAAWDAGFGRQGWFSLTREDVSAPLLDGWRAAIWIHAMAGLSWVVLIVGVALRHVEPHSEEAALLDGSPRQVVWSVTLRQVLPAIGAASMWLLVQVTGEMTVTDLYQVRTYAESIYLAISLGDELADVVRRVWPGMALVGVLIVAAFSTLLWFTSPGMESPALESPARRTPRFALGRLQRVAAPVVWILLLGGVGVPLASMAFNGGMQVTPVGDSWVRSWEFQKLCYLVATAPARFRVEIGWSLLIGGASALVALAVSVPLAWVARRPSWPAWHVVGGTALCLAVPGPLIGLGLIWLLNREQMDVVVWLYDRTIFAPCLALLVRVLPVAVLMNWYALRSVSQDDVDTAAMDGAGWWTRLGFVALPQRKFALAATWLVGLAIAMGDLSASNLVTPPGITTVAGRVFGLLHAGVDDQVAALCLALVALFVLLAVTVRWCLVASRLMRTDD